MAGTSTVLDFPAVTTLETTDILYLIRGTGTDRDKTSTIQLLQNYIGDAYLAQDITGSINLSNYFTNLVVVSNPSGTVTLTFTGALPLGKELIILNISSNTVNLAIESTTPVISQNDFKKYLSDGTDMLLLEYATQIYTNAAFDPIGTIKAWDKTFPSTPALSAYWKECDGTTISDTASPYNGYRIRNLNGANVELSVTWTADAGGAYGTISAVNMTALAIGDSVAGAGIVAGTYVQNISGTTITITDTAIAGAVTTTFSNGGRFVRGKSSSGAGEWDAFQNFQIGATADGSGARNYFGRAGSRDTIQASSATSGSTALYLQTNAQGIIQAIKPIDNGTNGTPRTASETRPINTGFVYIMKIK